MGRGTRARMATGSHAWRGRQEIANAAVWAGRGELGRPAFGRQPTPPLAIAAGPGGHVHRAGGAVGAATDTASSAPTVAAGMHAAATTAAWRLWSRNHCHSPGLNRSGAHRMARRGGPDRWQALGTGEHGASLAAVIDPMSPRARSGAHHHRDCEKRRANFSSTATAGRHSRMAARETSAAACPHCRGAVPTWHATAMQTGARETQSQDLGVRGIRWVQCVCSKNTRRHTDTQPCPSY
eukprot:COSAG01_NODE_8448_length_2782_cov_12.650391_4_plen_238_part_00